MKEESYKVKCNITPSLVSVQLGVEPMMDRDLARFKTVATPEVVSLVNVKWVARTGIVVTRVIVGNATTVITNAVQVVAVVGVMTILLAEEALTKDPTTMFVMTRDLAPLAID